MYKNPFNYTGAKFKLLSQILPLSPDKINTFVDLFGGSGELTFNTQAEHYIYNEKSKQLVNIFNNLDDDFIIDVEKVIQQYGLSKENKQGFLDLRTYYNTNLGTMSDRENAVILYCLLTHAFNYQIAFNSKGEYNMPSGKGRSYFSPQLKEKLTAYIDKNKQNDIRFLSYDFVDINIPSLVSSDDAFIYVDPPYYITVGAYERDYFCKWSEEYENKLLALLDDLSTKGYKWAFSNVFEHKGKSNDLLKSWASKYTIHYLNMDYKNCNYHTKDKSANSSVEVLITNY